MRKRLKFATHIVEHQNVVLVRESNTIILTSRQMDGQPLLPMGPCFLRGQNVFYGGLSAPHFGTSYQGYSSARMTSDSSVEKCGGANEVSCDWVRLHIFVAGKVNDKARVKLAKGAHPPLSSAAHCLTGVCRTWRSTTMTNRPLAPLLLAGSASFSNNLFLYLLTTPLPLQ